MPFTYMVDYEQEEQQLFQRYQILGYDRTDTAGCNTESDDPTSDGIDSAVGTDVHTLLPINEK